MPRRDRDDDDNDYRPRAQAGGSNTAVIVVVVVVAVLGVFGLAALACAGLFGGVLFSTSGKVQASKDRMKAQNKMKQISIGFHSQHDVDGWLQGPFAAGATGGGHSFRVGLLPYLEQNALYRRIDLTQPWDSAVNAPATGTVVAEYLDPSNPASVGTATPYRLFVGPGTVFENKAKMTKLHEIADGSSNTILYAAATQTVPWASPQELPYGPGIALPPLGSPQADGFHVAFADGSVRYLLRTIPDADLRSLIEKADGRVVNIP